MIFLFLPLTPYITRTLTPYFSRSRKLSSHNNIRDSNNLDHEGYDDRLILHIPSIGLNTEVEIEKDSSFTTPWKVKYTQFPDQGGNFVLAGHSYTYANPFNPTFFFLDELSVGDNIEVLWKNKVFKYEVYDILIVKPVDVGIQKSTLVSEITLYTCYPKYVGNMRLIIKGKLVSIE